MKLSAAVFSTSGTCMTRNEDNFLCGSQMADSDETDQCRAVETESDAVFAVFDGMGGEKDGHVISRICAEQLLKCEADCRDSHDAFYAEANRLTVAYMNEHGGQQSGSTAVLISFTKGQAFVTNIGDSRAYILRDGILSQLTEDHTAVRRLIRIGMLTPEEAAKDNRRHTLTQFIGIPESEFQISPFSAEPITPRTGDRFLLCSDGVHDTLDNDTLTKLLSDTKSDARTLAEHIVKTAMEHGSNDNVTALAVFVE